VTGGSKLDPRSVECRILGYATGTGNYKVQEVATRCVFVSRDVIFEEGLPHHTLTSVGEKTQQIPLFDTLSTETLVNNPTPNVTLPDPVINVPDPVITASALRSGSSNQNGTENRTGL
jgi:hypothetical protein